MNKYKIYIKNHNNCLVRVVQSGLSFKEFATTLSKEDKKFILETVEGNKICVSTGDIFLIEEVKDAHITVQIPEVTEKVEVNKIAKAIEHSVKQLTNRDTENMKYRKKPIVIEAFQWLEDTLLNDTPEWFQEAIKGGRVVLNGGTLTIDTLEGPHISKPGDYIIKGVKGELYPCKADIFEMTYEKVD